MTEQNITLGIQAIQAGQQSEGERLLKIALKTPNLSGTWRAVALIWLASITTDPNLKDAYYNDALAADPTNPQIREQADKWRATRLLPPTPAAPVAPPSLPGLSYNPPPAPISTGAFSAPAWTPPQTYPNAGNSLSAAQLASSWDAPPANLPKNGALSASGWTGGMKPVLPVVSGADHVVAIIGGPHGTSGGLFIAANGMVVTTRHAVGNLEQVMVEVEPRQQVAGQVVRSFPQYDLAFVAVPVEVRALLPLTQLFPVPDHAPLVIVRYDGQVLHGERRATKRMLPPHWIPTNLPDQAEQAGALVLDERGYWVGLMTRNKASSSDQAYALHIQIIQKCLETYRLEASQGERRYCPNCGHAAQAPTQGGYYCENCGSVTPQAIGVIRYFIPRTAPLYQERANRPCPFCGGVAGLYNGKCLRCGRNTLKPQP